MVKAYGKCILLGEHAVVYGQPALACALSCGVQAMARAAAKTSLCIASWNVSFSIDENRSQLAEEGQLLAEALGRLIASFTRPLPPMHIEVKTELSPGKGLGCSAAMGVAVARCIHDFVGSSVSDDTIASQALQWDRVFHGNPSGIDTTVAAKGGLLLFRKDTEALVLRSKQPLFVVIADTGQSASTKQMVQSVARQYEQNPQRMERVLQGIGELTLKGKDAIETGNLVSLGQCMNLSQKLLSSLLLSTSKIQELCDVALEAGALGAKLTGAGGGGCVLALAQDEGQAHVICAALASKATHCFVACHPGSTG